MANAEQGMTVEVAYATPQEQKIFEAVLPPGGTVEEAIRRSGVLEYFPEIDMEHCDTGVFGKARKKNVAVVDGERVEIYRPLIADPKEVRRQLAKQGKTMGKKTASR